MANVTETEAAPRTHTDRTGKCLAYKCKKACTAYEYREKVGVYPICQCGHTQQSHAFPEEKK